MIHTLLHIAAHHLEEYIEEKQHAKHRLSSQNSEEHLQRMAIAKAEEEIRHKRIYEDCKKAVIFASRANNVNLNTPKRKCDIDYDVLIHYMVERKYPNLSKLELKLIAGWEPVKFLASNMCDRICSKLGMESKCTSSEDWY